MIPGQGGDGKKPATVHLAPLGQEEGMVRMDGEPAIESDESCRPIAAALMNPAEIQVVLELVGFQLNRALAQASSFLPSPRGQGQRRSVMGKELRTHHQPPLEGEVGNRLLEAPKRRGIVSPQGELSALREVVGSFGVKHSGPFGSVERLAPRSTWNISPSVSTATVGFLKVPSALRHVQSMCGKGAFLCEIWAKECHKRADEPALSSEAEDPIHSGGLT